MSEISGCRPWDHVHATTGQTEYQIDVYREGGIEPDEWFFGTDKDLRDFVAALIKERSHGMVSLGRCHGCDQPVFGPADFLKQT